MSRAQAVDCESIFACAYENLRPRLRRHSNGGYGRLPNAEIVRCVEKHRRRCKIQGAKLNPAGSRAQPGTVFELVRASVAIVKELPRLNA